MNRRAKLLFLCTGNSCRSQMAEGWARALLGDRTEVHSAGTAPGQVDPRAIQVMREVGVSIEGQHSKHLDELAGIEFDLVVTVCDRAQQSCPVYPGTTRRVHHAFDDPPRLAAEASDESTALMPYRRVRDEIRTFVDGLTSML